MKWFSHSLNLKLSIGHFSTSISFNLILIILNSLILTIYFIFISNSIYYYNFTHFECHQKSKILTLSSSINHSLTRYTSLTMYTSLYLNLINIYINEMQMSHPYPHYRYICIHITFVFTYMLIEFKNKLVFVVK